MRLEVGQPLKNQGTVMEIELQDLEIYATVLGYDNAIRKINVTNIFENKEEVTNG